MNRHYFEKVARWCYYPATDMFQSMLDDGHRLGLGFSVSFLQQLRRWDRARRHDAESDDVTP
jgi:alpha-amylase